MTVFAPGQWTTKWSITNPGSTNLLIESIGPKLRDKHSKHKPKQVKALCSPSEIGHKGEQSSLMPFLEEVGMRKRK